MCILRYGKLLVLLIRKKLGDQFNSMYNKSDGTGHQWILGDFSGIDQYFALKKCWI